MSRRKELEGRKDILSSTLKRVKATLNDQVLRRSLRARLPELVRQVTENLEATDFESRQQLVRLLIDRVVVMPDCSVEIHYVLPVPTGGSRSDLQTQAIGSPQTERA